MKFWDFVEKIVREGYDSVEQYCNYNGCNYDDVIDFEDDEDLNDDDDY